MRTKLTSIKFFERLARTSAFDTLLVAALVVILYLVGHDGLRDMMRVA